MAIVRAPRPQSNFYILDKRISEDARLSWGARGMLIFLLGKPDHWKVSVQALINETEGKRASGRDAVYAMISELLDAGYMRRARLSSGEVEYVVSETPDPENPDVDGEPHPENPDPENPDPENPTLVSTDYKASTEVKARTERASRLPADWQPSEEMIGWAVGFHPTWSPSHARTVADNFKDYWTSKAGKDARKLDWSKVWRMWVRNEKPMRAVATTELSVAGQRTLQACEEWLREG